jgi:ribosomal protein S18 acetylase RimI-like enzyme
MSGLTITRIGPADIGILRDALPSFRFEPLSHLPYLKRAQAEEYWMDQIGEEVADGSSVAFVARVSDRIAGLALYTESPWDTHVIGRRISALKYLAAEPESSLGKNVVEALLRETVGHAAKRGFECLTAKVYARDTATTHALERNGFLLMDTLLVFLFDSNRTPLDKVIAPASVDGLSTRLATSEDMAELLPIAEKTFAHHFGRYHADPRIPPGTATEVYREWVRSSFRGWADSIVVAEVDGKIAGFAIWKNPSDLEVKHALDIAHVSIAGVHSDFFGRGIFTSLAYEGMRMLQGVASHIEGATHINNYPVHRAWLKLGWRITGARHSFHKWLTP